LQHWFNPGSQDHCRQECPPSCHMNVYKAQVIKTTRLGEPKQNNFHIFYASGEMEELHEELGYDKTLFIADFGGSLSFLLGISILSIIELIESAIAGIYYNIKLYF